MDHLEIVSMDKELLVQCDYVGTFIIDICQRRRTGRNDYPEIEGKVIDGSIILTDEMAKELLDFLKQSLEKEKG